MREVRPEWNVHGAGIYSEPQQSPARCKRGANPFGHNPECDCRASQSVPYEPDDPDSLYRYWGEQKDAREIDRQMGYE